MMVAIVIGLGANLPSGSDAPIETLQRAVHMVAEQVGPDPVCSPWYASTPVGVSGQPDFVNGAVRLDTELDAATLLATLHRIEDRLGRTRNTRWGPRVVDLDLLVYGDRLLPDARLWRQVAEATDETAFLDVPVVPHPRLHKRLFALQPLKDIWPDWSHPLTGKSIARMINEIEGRQLLYPLGPGTG